MRNRRPDGEPRGRRAYVGDEGASFAGPMSSADRASCCTIFTETVDDTQWRFRRDERIARGPNEVIEWCASGIPTVRPEIQLLYMAKSTSLKNQRDFEMARPHLTAGAAMWLKGALEITLPGHHWTQQLR